MEYIYERNFDIGHPLIVSFMLTKLDQIFAIKAMIYIKLF